MKFLRFRLVTFFLHVKPDLLISGSAYSEGFVNLFQNAFYFITFCVSIPGQANGPFRPQNTFL